MISLLINILLLPFKLVWILAGLVFSLCGKLATAGIGVVVMLVGLILCITLIGLPLGIILLILGLVLCLKGIF